MNDGDARRHVWFRVADPFHRILLIELAEPLGLTVCAGGGGRTRVRLLCTPDEADALLAEAGSAASVLQLLQLEAVAKAMKVADRAPSQHLLDMVAELRTELGNLVAGI
jgi:hypothetical protein